MSDPGGTQEGDGVGDRSVVRDRRLEESSRTRGTRVSPRHVVGRVNVVLEKGQEEG